MQDGDKERLKRPRISLPWWVKRFIYAWVVVMLTLSTIGYALYVLSGNWTPEHIMRGLFTWMGVGI